MGQIKLSDELTKRLRYAAIEAGMSLPKLCESLLWTTMPDLAKAVVAAKPRSAPKPARAAPAPQVVRGVVLDELHVEPPPAPADAVWPSIPAGVTLGAAGCTECGKAVKAAHKPNCERDDAGGFVTQRQTRSEK